MGTVENPLFNMNDVAKVIGDYSNVARKTSDYEPKYLIRDYHDDKGNPVKINLLTEIGLYRYLLQSKRPEAIPFQEYVYGVLKTERLRVVNVLQFRIKILEDEREWNRVMSGNSTEFFEYLCREHINNTGIFPDEHPKYKQMKREIKCLFDRDDIRYARKIFYKYMKNRE
jgi:prophage antirepressor-like protein